MPQLAHLYLLNAKRKDEVGQQGHGRGTFLSRLLSYLTTPDPKFSPLGNLYFSVLLRPTSAAELPKLNFAVAIAVAKTARDNGVIANVKWPNDVWIGDKKVSGVIVDSSFMGKQITAVVGCGVRFLLSPLPLLFPFHSYPFISSSLLSFFSASYHYI